jgi:uncharacterized membrane protein
MTDVSTPQAAPGTPTPSLISTTLLIYGLYGLAAVIALAAHGFPPIAPLGGIAGLVAIIMAHVKRGDAAGTWLASHYRWLIRTFWFSVLWGVLGAIIFAVLLIVVIGIFIAYAIWLATTIWVIYRLIRGYLLFKDSEPVPGM